MLPPQESFASVGRACQFPGMGKKVIVVGAGIFGASLAWHLAKSGADVTVVDAGEPGGIATAGSFAWINASWGNPEQYFRLRERSMLEWRKVDREVPGLEVDWCGGLLWDLPREQLEAYADEHRSWGYGIERVGPVEIRSLEPTLKSPPSFALHVAEEGKIEPQETALALLEGAVGRGATVLGNTPVKWLIEKNSKVTGVAIADGALHADEVIVAAGIGSAALLGTLGVRIKIETPPGLLAYSKPLGEVLRGLVMAPEFHVKQDRQGRLVIGCDFAGDFAAHDSAGTAERLIAAVRQTIAGAEQVPLDFFKVTERPTPADGFPLVGRVAGWSGLSVLVSHSGVTLAPALGRMLTEEVLTGNRDELLAAYGANRAMANAGA